MKVNMMYGKRDIAQLVLSAAMGMAVARDLKGEDHICSGHW